MYLTGTGPLVDVVLSGAWGATAVVVMAVVGVVVAVVTRAAGATTRLR
jgi:hypothetical protein